MTWFSAVSLFALVAGGAPQTQAGLEDPAWTKVRSTVAKIMTLGQPSGLAVLIDPHGYFLAHRSSVPGDKTMVSFGANNSMVLSLAAVDDMTQLALLKAENWVETGQAYARVASKATAGSKLLAATLAGPVHGEFVTDKKVGQMRASLRYIPLSEIRLESNIGKLGGAMVFDQDAQLVGILGATLSQPANPASAGVGGGAATGRTKGSVAADVASTKESYGPQGMTVAYSLGPSVIKRVVDGLMSFDHKVKHPSVGLFFKNGNEAGALIEAVLPGPAAEAGIKVGDLVTAVDSVPVKNQVDFAMELFNHNAGERITITLKRGDKELTVTVLVGYQELN